SLGALCKNIENEVRTVEDLYLEFAFEVFKLRRGKLVVENDGAYFVFVNKFLYFLSFSATNKGFGIGLRKFLCEAAFYGCARGVGQKLELVHIFLQLFFVLVLGNEPDEDGSFVKVFFFL